MKNQLYSINLCFRLVFFSYCLFSINSAFSLDEYQPLQELKGDLNLKGSDTVGKAAELWVKSFQDLYPHINIQLSQKGSGDGAKAIIDGVADVGNMSRNMKRKEIKTFEKKYGYKPTAIRVGIDAVAVAVNKDNPINQLTIAQIDSIFSSTHKCKGQSLSTWGEVGVSGELASQQPNLKIRNPNSGTRAFFTKKALCKGTFKTKADEYVDTFELMQKISQDISAVGFGGLSTIHYGVKPIAIAKEEGKTFFLPTKDNAASGKYPLSRYLFMYVNKVPGQNTSPALAEFLKFVTSKQGQDLVEQAGYVSINDKIALANQKTINK